MVGIERLTGWGRRGRLDKEWKIKERWKWTKKSGENREKLREIIKKREGEGQTMRDSERYGSMGWEWRGKVRWKGGEN